MSLRKAVACIMIAPLPTIARNCFFALLFVVGQASLSVRCAQAQRFELTPEVAKYLNGVINESINATTLLSTQDEVSTGSFTQRQDGQPDKGYRTFRLPAEFLLGDTKGDISPFFNGNLAYLKSTSGLAPVDNIGDDDFAVTNLYAVSCGTGAYISLSDSWLLAPAFSLTYSHIQNSYDFNNPYSQSNFAPVSQDLFNWDMDLLTYAPEVKLFYETELGITTLEYQLGYVYLFNDSIRTESSVIDINSSTGLLINRISLHIPTGVAVSEAPVAVRPFFQWNNISGHAVAGLGLRDIFEMGADLVIDILESGSWFSHVTVGGSYVSGKDFEGYHIGAGVDF